MIAGFAGLAISLLYTLLQSESRDKERYDPYDRGGGPPPPR